jgi:hypothetical protein
MRCNCIILVLFQVLYMFWAPAVPIIRSTILQLAVTGITNMFWIAKCMVASTLKVSGMDGGYITVVELELNI